MGRVAALAQTMIETPQGLETINFGAGQLAELAMNKDPKMYLTLKSLANAKSIEAVAEIPDCLMIFGNAFITFKFTK